MQRYTVDYTVTTPTDARDASTSVFASSLDDACEQVAAQVKASAGELATVNISRARSGGAPAQFTVTLERTLATGDSPAAYSAKVSYADDYGRKVDDTFPEVVAESVPEALDALAKAWEQQQRRCV